MSKQTAVEWLFERLERMIPRTALYNIDKEQYFKQAKAMERQQIVEAFQTEWSQHNYSGEQYYANTYGKEADHEA